MLWKQHKCYLSEEQTCSLHFSSWATENTGAVGEGGEEGEGEDAPMSLKNS